MNKKVVFGAVGAAVVVVGGIAVGLSLGGDGDSGPSFSSEPLKLQVKSGTWVVPDDTTVSKSTGYIALKVKMTNVSKGDAKFLRSDFKLKDGSTSKSAVDFYADDDMTMLTSTSDLSAKDSATGYVVFKVNKDVKKDYKLVVKGTDEDYKTLNESVVKVDVSKYKDNTQSPVKAMQAYVDAVFLNKGESSEKTFQKLLANNLSDEKKNMATAWDDTLDDIFYDQTLTDTAKTKTMQAFQSANAKKATAEYKVKELTPNKAEVEITPSALSLSGMDDSIDAAVDEVLDKNEDARYSDAEAAVYQALVENFDKAIEKATVKKGESITIKMTKEDGKWLIDSDSEDMLQDDYAGDIY